MRYLEVLSPLLEHNVVNVDRIKSYVEKFAAHTAHVNAQEWFRLVLARFLEKNENVNVPMTDKTQPKPKPDWLDGAITRGDDLRVFVEPDDMTAQFDHLVDWFNSLNEDEQGKAFLDRRDRVMAITVQAALQKSELWVKSFSKKAAALALNVTEVSTDGVFSWVKPNDKNSMMRDGGLLNNCLGTGTYWENIASGSQVLYILHDGKSLPHVALRMMANGDVCEIKGKNNKPPIGRYVDLCKRFLNEVGANINATGSGMSDLRAMGLNFNATDGKITSIRDLGEIVWTQNGVEVTKVQGGGGFMDYWFHSARTGEIARLTERSDGMIDMKSVDRNFADLLRPILTKFLNEYFETGMSEPVGTAIAISGNFTIAGISYNYQTKVWGTVDDISVVEVDNDEVRVVSLGISPKVVDYKVYRPKDNLDFLGVIRLTNNSLKLFPPQNREDKETASKTMAAALNNLEKLHGVEIDRYSQSQCGVYMNFATKKYGAFKDVSDEIWSKDDVAMFRLQRGADVVENSLNRFYRGDEQLFEFEGAFCNEKGENGKLLLQALRESDELKTIDWTGVNYTFGNPQFFYGNGKWGNGSTVGDVYHKVGPILIKFVKRKEWTSYFFSDDSAGNHSVARISFQNSNQPVDGMLCSFEAQPKGLPTAALWLMHDLKVAPLPLEGDTDASKILFNIGLTYSLAKNAWGLIQDGKVKAKVGDIKAVTWRNRTFVVNGDRIVGFFKVPDGFVDYVPANNSREMYRCLEVLMPEMNLQFHEGKTEKEWALENGFKLDRFMMPESIERLYPTEIVMSFDDGFVWKKLAYDPDFKNKRENEEAFNPNRYSLRKEGVPYYLRATFDESDYLYKIEGWQPESPDTLNAVQKLASTFSNHLIALVNKAGKKFTAQQTTHLKVYSKNGKYVSVNGDPEMIEFNNGKIKFDDNTMFERSGANRWWLKDTAPRKPDEEYYDPTILYVELDDHGIETVKVSKKEAKRNMHSYLDHIRKLLELYQQSTG